MECKWLVENHVFDEDISPLINEIKKQGMQVKQVSYIPFENGDYDFYPENSCVIGYGSLQLVSKIKNKPWFPSVWATLENYRCVNYYAHWGEFLLNKDYIMLPFNELHRRKDELYDQKGIADTIFIRPDDGYKSFTGNVIYKEEWDESIKLMEFSIEASLSQAEYGKTKTDLVIVAPPRNIIKEWRFFVIDRKVITGSQYRENGKLKPKADFPKEAFELAQEIVNSTEWQPDSAFSIDICQTETGFYLLEIGAFSSSGMYHMDVSLIVSAAKELALKEWNEIFN